MARGMTPSAAVLTVAVVTAASIAAGQIYVKITSDYMKSADSASSANDTAENDDVENTAPAESSAVAKETYDYTIEVPSGSTAALNGETLSGPVETGVSASNFFQFTDTSWVPLVDVYEVKNISEEPELTINGESYVLLKDAVSGHMLAGRPSSGSDDPDWIEKAQLLSQYPSKEATVGQVGAVSLTSSSWYPFYTTLANTWFTDHSISNFSNQKVLNAVIQSDDTAVADIIFDYYADSGEYQRTWYIGYQLTFVKSNGTWLIGGVEVNNELNPGNHGLQGY